MDMLSPELRYDAPENRSQHYIARNNERTVGIWLDWSGAINESGTVITAIDSPTALKSSSTAPSSPPAG